MKYRVFPGTDVGVSEVGLGTWTLSTGWWGDKTDAQAIEMLRRSLDEHGINFFDAADTYGNGRAERQLAEAFRGRRHEVVIATKVGYDIYDEAAQAARRGQSELPMRTDPAFIRMAVDRCLERLETDYIDVLQIHNAKMEHVRQADLWGTLRELQREGKIRAWGAAFGPAIGWLYEAVELVEREPEINTIQMIWNILEQHPGTPMIEAARAHAPNCCFNVRVTHASGMLEGKYTVDTVFADNDHRRHRPRSWLVNGVKKIETLDFLKRDMTLGQASLKWLLAEPLVVSTLPNIYDDEQLDEFAAAPDLRDLTAEELDRVARLELRRRGRTDGLQGHHGAGVINLWHDLSPGRHPPEEVTAVIEIPFGSRNKYELDKATGLMKLDRVLYSSVHYPGDYGFIPRTLHEDGDPLDVLVLVKEETFSGCMIDVRPLGVLKMLDRGEPDDKILGVPRHDPAHEEYFDIGDIPQHTLKEVQHFFATYKDLEGKRVQVLGWEKSEVAMRVISESIVRYEHEYLDVGP